MLDRIQNEVFWAELGVASMTEKVSGRLWWFGHVHKRSMVAPVKKVESIKVERARKGG